jgi:hypothetical protein
MNENAYKLVFGVVFSFLFLLIVLLVGMFWGKFAGGWRNTRLRKGWITFCLALPIVSLGMMYSRLSEESFYRLRRLGLATRF